MPKVKGKLNRDVAKQLVEPDKTERLIELVRHHPGLYDQRSPNYMDARMAYNTWESIANELKLTGVTGRN